MSAEVTYRRVKHAAHYMFNDPRGGHDLEQWDCPDFGRSPGNGYPTRPEGVPTNAEFHSGYLAEDGTQRWLFVRRAAMSEFPACVSCRNRGAS